MSGVIKEMKISSFNEVAELMLYGITTTPLRGSSWQSQVSKMREMCVILSVSSTGASGPSPHGGDVSEGEGAKDPSQVVQ